MGRQKYVTVGDYTEDVERMADEIWIDSQGKIVDRDTFDLHFLNFVGFRGKITRKQEQILSPKVFDAMRKKHPKISNERVFTKAGGKNLKQDQKKTSKVVVTDPREYQRLTAQKSDLKGLDTKPKPQFRFVGRVKGKVVRARKVMINLKGKQIERFRDRKGRFVSRKK